MKTSTITIRLDDALGRELDQACARTGRTRSDLARDALRRQLALLRFERVRRRVLPLAESQGYLTDDDVFRDIMKVFFDTNVLIAAFATQGLCADLFAHVLLEHGLVVGEVVLTELRTTLRTKLKLPKKTIDEIEAQDCVTVSS